VTAALALLEEQLDQALLDAGVLATPTQVQEVAQGVADWVDLLRSQEAVRADVDRVWFPDRRPLSVYWSLATLEGLALMLRRRR
jgi:hypothetical protein